MEIQIEIIPELLALVKNARENPIIKEHLDSLYALDIKSLVEGDSKSSEISQKIYTEIAGSTYITDSQKLLEAIAGIVKPSLTYLSQAYEEGNIKALIIFLNLNCYLKIPLNYIEPESQPEAKQKLSEEIHFQLKNFYIRFDVPHHAPYFEKELKNQFENGVIERDLEKVYDFIHAVENGRGFPLNFLIANLAEFLFQIESQKFIAYINSLDQPQYSVFYFQYQKRDYLAAVLSSSELDNVWSIVELIRQLVERNEQSPVVLAEMVAIERGLSALYKLDKKTYVKSVSFFHNRYLFNVALGHQVLGLNQEDLRNVFSTCLPINRYESFLEIRKTLLDILEKKKHKNLSIILETVYRRWCILKEQICSSDDYQNTLLLTDFGHYVIAYHVVNTSPERVKGLILCLIDKIQWIETEWFKDETQQTTKFHLYLTELYLLSFAYHALEIVDTWVSQRVFSLNYARIKYNNNRDIEKFDPLKRIKENIPFIHRSA